MKPYLSLLSARFRVLLQYRAAAIAGFGTQLFWGLIRMMIFQSFYDSSSAPQPLNRADAVTYIWLGQAMLHLLPWNLDPDIRGMVRNGTVQASASCSRAKIATRWQANVSFCGLSFGSRRGLGTLRMGSSFPRGFFPAPRGWSGVDPWALSWAGSLGLFRGSTGILGLAFRC